MEFGTPVEVNQVWAGCAQGHGNPLRHWFKGYTFVRQEGRTALVRHTSGVFAGCEVRFPVNDVRAAG
jgi:hypothetical protein